MKKNVLTILMILLSVFAGFSQSQVSRSAEISKNPTLDSRILLKPLKTNQPNARSTYKSTSENVTMTILLDEYTFPNDISDEGDKAIILLFGGGSAYWTADGGVQGLTGEAYSVAEDGLVAGTFPNADYMYQGTAMNTGGTWDYNSNTWTFLGENPNQPEFFGPDYNSVWGMSGDGVTLAGMQWYPDYSVEAFKWTEQGGYAMIGAGLPFGSRPNGVSRDGSLIYGWAETSSVSRSPVIFTGFGVFYVDQTNWGEAFGSSTSGSYVVGEVGSNNFIWSPDEELVLFPNSLNAGAMTSVAVSNNKSVYGYTNEAWPPFPDSRRAFARLPDGTMQSFNDYAENRGMADAQDWTFFSINDVTPDGNTFLGAGITPENVMVTFKLTFEPEVTTHHLTLLSDPDGIGNQIGEGDYEAGTMVTVSTEPTASGYFFQYWMDENGNNISEDLSFVYEMPDSAVTLTALYLLWDGTNTLENKQMSAYPNPASDVLNLEFASTPERIVIYDSKGVEVVNQAVTEKTIIIPLNNLPNGLYTISASFNNQVITRKIQVVK